MGPGTLHARVLWDGTVDNDGLVALTVRAAREAVVTLRKAARPVPCALDVLPRWCWLYCREHAEYHAEQDTQYVRMPWAFVEDGVGDCKSTAVFIGAVCRAAGANVKLRFTAEAADGPYSHVYAIINGVPVDPLLPFGVEAFSLRSIDYPL